MERRPLPVQPQRLERLPRHSSPLGLSRIKNLGELSAEIARGTVRPSQSQPFFCQLMCEITHLEGGPELGGGTERTMNRRLDGVSTRRGVEWRHPGTLPLPI